MDRTQLAFNVFIGLGVAALLAVTAVNFKKKGTSDWTPFDGGLKSPIRVVGGSITFRTKSKWQNTGPAGCSTTNGFDNCFYTTATSLDASEIKVIVEGTPLTTSGITDPWKIELFAFNPDGGSVTSNGVSVCTSDNSGNCGTAPSAAYVTLKPIGSDKPGFYDSKYDGPPPKASSFGGKRFHNKQCHVENGELCEHLGRIVMTIGTNQPITFECPDGDCRVFIGP